MSSARNIGWITLAILASLLAVAFTILRNRALVTSGNTPAASRWQFAAETSEMDGQKTLLLWIDAEHSIDGTWRAVRPQLILKSEGGKLSVAVRTHLQAQPEYGLFNQVTVRIRFNDGSPTKQRWTEATSHTAFLAPNSDSLIKQMAGSSKFLFEFTPYQRTEEVISFDLTGLREELPRLVSAKK